MEITLTESQYLLKRGMTGEDIYIILGHELSDFKVALASRQSGWDWAEFMTVALDWWAQQCGVILHVVALEG